MRLADFIDNNMPAILGEWDSFASSLLSAGSMDTAALRDDAEQMLQTIVKDLRTPQTRAAQVAKSKGHAPTVPWRTAAQHHALSRAAEGFNIRQMIAEYRALRASVLHLWGDAGKAKRPDAMEDAGRFNEAIDQAIAESVDCFTTEVDRWRNLLLGTLSHDLRGPLNAISVTAQLIAQMSAGRSVYHHTETLIRNGKYLEQLLDDLLDYNRTSLDIGIRVNPKPADLALICNEEIDLLRTALPAFTIEFMSEGALQGDWDASRIKQALSNLTLNAAKYGDKNGIFRVSLRGEDAHAYLSVENNGPDIPTEQMDSLFEPLRRHAFADAQSERVSLGLGLFIVRQIAIAHGGDVDVESANGKTRFTMTLPKSHISQRTPRANKKSNSE